MMTNKELILAQLMKAMIKMVAMRLASSIS